MSEQCSEGHAGELSYCPTCERRRAARLQPQPSLTPADLIALRDHREYLDGYLAETLAELEAGTSGVMVAKGLRVGYKRILRDLDTLITRLSCPTCGGACVYQGKHPQSS